MAARVRSCLLFTELTALAFAFTQMAGAVLTNRCVIEDNLGAAEPYDSPANLDAYIQTAIDYVYAGETVLVSAATYDAGGVTNHPIDTVLTNRVVITNAITVRSANNNPTNTLASFVGTISVANWNGYYSGGSRTPGVPGTYVFIENLLPHGTIILGR